MQPLKHITVVSLEQAVAAPFATRQLADLGARVIKVERPGTGDFARAYDTRARGISSHFAWINRSKQSLTLDLKAPEGLAALRKLIATADVFVQNLAPGAAARMGLDAATLHTDHPGLILCNISGYGADGPHRHRKAYDLLIQAEAGFLSVTGTPDSPAKGGISVADIAAGMYAYSSILAALIERGQTGIGRDIDISMLEALAEWMGYPMYYATDGAPPPDRAGASHATIFPYGPFATGDGGTVILGLQNEREWARFCETVLMQPELTADARFHSNAARSDNRAALTALIETGFADLSTAEVLHRLDAAGIANARMNDMAGLWAHDQLAARNRWHMVDSPAGPLPALLPPGLGAGDGPQMGAIPALGAQSDAILQSLGYSAEDIAALRRDGIV